jgi:hypothetical protein
MPHLLASSEAMSAMINLLMMESSHRETILALFSGDAKLKGGAHSAYRAEFAQVPNQSVSIAGPPQFESVLLISSLTQSWLLDLGSLNCVFAIGPGLVAFACVGQDLANLRPRACQRQSVETLSTCLCRHSVKEQNQNAADHGPHDAQNDCQHNSPWRLARHEELGDGPRDEPENDPQKNAHDEPPLD